MKKAVSVTSTVTSSASPRAVQATDKSGAKTGTRKNTSGAQGKIGSKRNGETKSAKATKDFKQSAPLTIAKIPLQQSASSDEQLELTESQLEDLKQKLFRLREEVKLALTGKSEVFNASSHNESIIKGDDAEVAEKQRQSNAALQEMDMLKNRLVMVERALKKMEEGIYGLCEETEEPIAYERLIAIPWAQYGVKVQEMRERRLRDYKGTRVGL